MNAFAVHHFCAANTKLVFALAAHFLSFFSASLLRDMQDLYRKPLI